MASFYLFIVNLFSFLTNLVFFPASAPALTFIYIILNRLRWCFKRDSVSVSSVTWTVVLWQCVLCETKALRLLPLVDSGGTAACSSVRINSCLWRKPAVVWFYSESDDLTFYWWSDYFWSFSHFPDMTPESCDHTQPMRRPSTSQIWPIRTDLLCSTSLFVWVLKKTPTWGSSPFISEQCLFYKWLVQFWSYALFT